MNGEQTWTSRELPILRAMRAAEEAGGDIGTAARDAVPDLPRDLYNETINALDQARFLDAAVQPYGDGKLQIHIRRLLPKGREAVGQWPAAPSAAGVEERKRRRLRFMDMLYDEVGDDTLAVVSVEDLADRLEWSGPDAEVVVEFLRVQGLLDAHMGNQVSITNPGIVEVERSRLRPEEPTEHFPPPNSVYIAGDAHDVQSR